MTLKQARGMQSGANETPNSDLLAEQIEEEIANARKVVEQHESEAKSRGTPLKLSGARYRIYNTVQE